MKHLYTYLIILFLLLPFQIMAQGQVANRLIRGSNFQITVGYNYQRVDLGDLNKAISASGLPELSENINSVSFLTQNISNKWMASLRTSYSFTNQVKGDTREIEFRNQQYAVGLGYDLLTSEKARLLPSITATLGRNMLLIQDKSKSSANFQNLLQNPSQEVSLSNYSYLADVGIAFHYLFYRRERERETGKTSTWVPVIFKAGYQFEVGNSDFKFDGDKVQGVPDVSLGGIYASIHIGLGTRLLPID
ncbi:hypothetical protein ACSX1A_02965 [Pontibacter sp. MBLB2868]|uniref:hypothetical protein n=1 Tax=Pontibacter sp. MBLB2868 TaxID=3451555 RepID=UPI003F7546DB